MGLRSPSLATTSSRATMPLLLITACLFASVPSAEALPSLPSISSSTGIAMAVVSVALALSLVVGLVFMLKGLRRFFGWKKRAKQTETGQPGEIDPPQSIAVVTDPPVEAKPSQEELQHAFYEFLQNWNGRSLKVKEQFISGMVEDFLVVVTPAMAMDALQTMLSEEVHSTAIWIRMLRFTMMLERDLFHWDQTRLYRVPERDKTIPSQTHQRFQAFLIAAADEILSKYGDVARPDEEGEAGFMRFIAYLFGFVCGHRRILTLMKDTWTRLEFRQTDASRAMVWGYRRWMEDPRSRVPGHPTTTKSNGKHLMFHKLMQELRVTRPVPRLEEGSRAQHLLFALGCGYEPDWAEGPLAYMSDKKIYPFPKHFYGVDYLWLMMGRDLVLGNAWQWMCKKKLSEHDRMCNRFGNDGELYDHIADMVMKYEQDYYVEKGQCLMSVALRYSKDGVCKIDFGDHRAWYERYQRSKKAIGTGINAWLLKNAKQELPPPVPRDESEAVDYYEIAALPWEACKKNGKSQDDSE